MILGEGEGEGENEGENEGVGTARKNYTEFLVKVHGMNA